jgi:hypothetical protein
MLPRRSNAGSSATSAPGPGAPRPHLRRDCPSSCHICTRTKWAHPARSAPELRTLLSPRCHMTHDLRRDPGSSAPHICTHSCRRAATSAPGPTGLAAAAPAPTLGSPRCHSCAANGHAPVWRTPAPSGGTARTASPRIGLNPATSAPGPRAPLPRLRPCSALSCQICAG